MEFAKYYNVTKLVKEQLLKGNLQNYVDYSNIYVCNDVNDFWVARVLPNTNEGYEKEEGCILLERNSIDKYDIIEDMEKQDILYETLYGISSKYAISKFFDCIDTKKLIQLILEVDELDMSNWNTHEYASIEDAIEDIDGGYGIIELN